LVKKWSFFNVFHYISFRSFLAFILAFLLAVFLIPLFAKQVKKRYAGYVRKWLEHHQEKKYTPSFGGIVIIGVLVLISFLFLRLDTPYPYLASLLIISFGIIGFLDDYLKVKNGEGLTMKQKLALQFLAAFLLAFLTVKWVPIDTKLYFPFFKHWALDLGEIGYLIWFTLFLVLFSNAVNITDGLDGLAIGSSLTTFMVLAIVSYLAGNIIYAHYLYIPYVKFVGELTILAMAFLGAGLGFLWHNTYPAKIFMGDVGALAIGALIGFYGLLTKQEFLTMVAGGLFLIEFGSSLIQMGYFKLTKILTGKGKRIFAMAPLHHLLEKLGWDEPQIVVRLWIISSIFAILSLMLLKLR